MKKLNKDQRRQGDVFLQRIPELPPDAELVDTGHQNVVIAHGENSGHKHQFQFRDADMFRGGGDVQIVKVLRDAGLCHEEHDRIDFPPGVYERPVQVEHCDDMEPRIVSD